METKIKGFIEVNVQSKSEIKVLVNILNIADVTSKGENNAVISTNAGPESYIITKESYNEIISLIKEAQNNEYNRLPTTSNFGKKTNSN